MSTDDQKAFQSLREELKETYAPQSGKEWMFFDLLVGNVWRLRRIWNAEAEVFSYEHQMTHNGTDGFGSFLGDADSKTAITGSYNVINTPSTSTLRRYIVGCQRQVVQCHHELIRLQAARNGAEVAPPIAVDLNLG